MKGVVDGRGHKVSNSNVKTKRAFKVNIQSARFFSYVLGVYVGVRVPNRTKRTIDKFGDLDSFLVGVSKSRLTDYGLSLRRKVMRKLSGASGVVAAPSA